MMLRAFAWSACGLAATMVCAPVAAPAQELVAQTVAAPAREAALAGDAAAANRDLALPPSPPSLSPDCLSKRVAGERFRRPLRVLSRAVHTRRKVRVLAIGSSSTEGVGASSQAAAYVAKLEAVLEGSVKGLDFVVIGSGRSGEEAQGAADRMKREVEEAKPDLVVWQVGTNDAIRHVSLERFKNCLKTTLAWLRDQHIDVVLVDPQYGDALAKDEYYERMVAAVSEVARDSRVVLVDRFESMRELAQKRGDRFYLAADNLHLNDTGHRCMAEQLAQSIVDGLIDAEPGVGRSGPDTAARSLQ